VMQAAEAAGITERTVHKWLAVRPEDVVQLA
jgi:hypothetical protein